MSDILLARENILSVKRDIAAFRPGSKLQLLLGCLFLPQLLLLFLHAIQKLETAVIENGNKLADFDQCLFVSEVSSKLRSGAVTLLE